MNKSNRPMIQQQLMKPEEFKKEIVEGKLRVTLSIIGYCMLIIGFGGVFVALFFKKISLGGINFSEKTLKKFTALSLAIIWCLFLIAESIKLYDMNNPKSV